MNFVKTMGKFGFIFAFSVTADQLELEESCDSHIRSKEPKYG